MSDSQKWLVLTFSVLLGGLLYLLAPILLPFAISAVLAYLSDPLVDRLEMISIKSWRLGRTQSVILVFLTLTVFLAAILVVIIPSIEAQISLFLSKLPDYIGWLNTRLIPMLQQFLHVDIEPVDSAGLIEILKDHWQKAGGILATLIGSVSRSGTLILEWLMNLLLIPVITFYLLRDWDELVARVHDLFPRRSAPTVAKLAAESDQVLGAFMRGQFYVMIVLGMIYSTGLSLLGLDLSLLIGMMAGLVSFVPYLGAIVGIVAACLAALLQFQDPMYLIPVAIVFMVGQALEGMLLTPWLVGDQIGLHPVAVIFAVLAGGQLFGFLGVLLALPVASVIMVLLRYLHRRYTGSGFYSEQFKL
ncbi:AI-2E family transporter [Methylomarinum sp. Ch1-1]|uniref:AI-2E family transporter n=1 Tax=Methylomarinum roseum TaxID=3067653 RepID=A0AAU7NTN9_9GAMM|nr:AI-2E family transporter [Methylomarinum sp. Ch1-1]MDP4519567.1 AI-2E family transporter [Methylomarinum sp. Ch1-1]